MEDGQQLVMRSCRDPIRERLLGRNDATVRCLLFPSSSRILLYLFPFYIFIYPENFLNIFFRALFHIFLSNSSIKPIIFRVA